MVQACFIWNKPDNVLEIRIEKALESAIDLTLRKLRASIFLRPGYYFSCMVRCIIYTWRESLYALFKTFKRWTRS